MRELVQKEQPISIVPNDFKCANKGKIIDVKSDGFSMEVKYAPTGIRLDNLCEFYSQTQNGVLFFESDVKKIDGKILWVKNPIKHKFLQRRKFTRIKFIYDMFLENGDKVIKISTQDLSAGGMKFRSNENIDIEPEYKVSIPLSTDQEIKCKFQPIRIEKNDDGLYTLSGRFKNLTNIDKMTLVQFCMKKNIENVNK